MGTRSLVHIKNGDFSSQTLVTIYRQFDGYPEGMGQRLFAILNEGKTKILNGYGNDKVPEAFNGMGCMSAYIIEHLKESRIGNVYIYPADSKDVGEEWTYTIYQDNGELMISIDGYDIHTQFDVLSNGYKAFTEWLEVYNKEEE